MEITALEFSGIVPSLQAMRLPKGGAPKSSSVTTDTDNRETDTAYTHSEDFTATIAKADIELAGRLVKAGNEHAKAVRGILVYVRITAPIYWWREMETYRAGRERLSCESTMHIDCKNLQGAELQQAKAAIPMGKEQTAVDFYSYQCLRNIYKQRKHHRLPEWRKFCQWVESLPFAAELITC